MNTGFRWRNHLIIAFLLQLAVFSGWGQKVLHGIVKDAHSEEPIPFASVQFTSTTIGKQTAADGTFSFTFNEWPSDSLVISNVGYETLTIALNKEEDSLYAEIELERGGFVEEVVVRSKKFNKGLFVWKKIVQHKGKNDRYRFDNFSYELYNKLELDIKNINFSKVTNFRPLRPLGKIINEHVIDSSGEGGPRYLPAYLTEVISDYYFQRKPQKRREIIKAVNTNGIDNESFVKYLGGMNQNVNIYANFIPVFDRQFVSPASDNGDLYYNYNVVDTQQINGHRYFHLVFSPRRKGTNTFDGDAWVHVDTWAIQKINLGLGKDANVNFIEKMSLIQEFTLLNDSIWFVSRDKFIAEGAPPGVGKINPGFIGRKNTTYRNIQINDDKVTAELSKNKILEEVITLKDAPQKDTSFWTDSRHEQLTKTEEGIVKMIDNMMNDDDVQRLYQQLKFLTTGYKQLGKFEIGPWFNWVSANRHEGLRVRFDLNTSTKFSEKVWIQSYLAYGFKDKKIKGRGEIFYLPTRDPRRYLSASYVNDLDFGQHYYGEVSADNIFSLTIRKPGIERKFINVEEKKIEGYNTHRSGLSERLTFTHRKYRPLLNLPVTDSFSVAPGREVFSNTEVAFRLRFAYLEKFLEGSFLRMSLGSPYPIGEVYIAQGIGGVFKSGYSYTKLSASVSDNIPVAPFGELFIQAYGGKTVGTVPYMLLDIAPGNDLHYYNKYAFNMMTRYEFIHDEYAGINFEHNIGNGIFRLFPKLKLRQFYNVKALWGSLSEKNRAYNFKTGHPFQTLNGNTYMEVGTGIDNILKVLRLDLVWRVLPAADKVSSKDFGIFGSFRFTF